MANCTDQFSKFFNNNENKKKTMIMDFGIFSIYWNYLLSLPINQIMYKLLFIFFIIKTFKLCLGFRKLHCLKKDLK